MTTVIVLADEIAELKRTLAGQGIPAPTKKKETTP